MTRRRAVAAGLGAALVTAIVVAVVASRHHDKTPRRRVTLPSGRGGTPAGDALARVLTAEGRHTFHAVYAVQSSSEGGFRDTGGTVELWRKPPRIRQDVALTADGQAVKEAAFYTDTGAVSCVRNPGPGWACHREGTPSESVFDQVEKQASGGPVVATNQTIGGRKVQCFGAGSGQTAVELCATTDGTPVRVTAGVFRYELKTLSTSVDDDVFTPPAPVT